MSQIRDSVPRIGTTKGPGHGHCFEGVKLDQLTMSASNKHLWFLFNHKVHHRLCLEKNLVQLAMSASTKPQVVLFNHKVRHGLCFEKKVREVGHVC